MNTTWVLVDGYPVYFERADDGTRYACPDLPGCHGVIPFGAKLDTSVMLAIALWKQDHLEWVSMRIAPYIAHLEGEAHVEE